MIRVLLLSVSILALVCTVGCNTEKMWADNQKPDGPTTDVNASEADAFPDIQTVQAQEVDIVEEVLANRAKYKRSLLILRDYYREHGYNNKRQWAESELADLNRVKTFKYILSAEIPVSSLRPTDSIAKADEMYRRGLELMKEGGHGVPALFRQDRMREALQMFADLITRYFDMPAKQASQQFVEVL